MHAPLSRFTTVNELSHPHPRLKMSSSAALLHAFAYEPPPTPIPFQRKRGCERGVAEEHGMLEIAPGMRRSLPNARVMIHQPSGGVSGQVRCAHGSACLASHTHKIVLPRAPSHVPPCDETARAG